VDGVDNKVTMGMAESDKNTKTGKSVARSSDGSSTDRDGRPAAHGAARGSDLARESLHAAQAAARARGARAGRANSAGSPYRRRRRWSGPRADDRDPQPLGRLAARLSTDRGWVDRLAGGQVFGRWAALVGADVAEHARPLQLRDGELVVQADSTAWATQLRLLQRQLVARIAAGVGNGVVRRIKVSAPSAPSWQHGLRRVPGRGPRDTYG
jgi:predicted nucleic acid-binding Zn ribbon protein